MFLHYRNPAPEQPTPEATAAPASAQVSETAPPAPAPAGAARVRLQDAARAGSRGAEGRARARESGGTGGRARRRDLQVGSFKGMDQAEKMQARLALHGIESRIQRFTLQDETWYRVRIGPIGTVEELDAVRAKLAEAEVEATAVSSQVVETPPP